MYSISSPSWKYQLLFKMSCVVLLILCLSQNIGSWCKKYCRLSGINLLETISHNSVIKLIVLCVSRTNKKHLIPLIYCYCDIFTYMFRPVIGPTSVWWNVSNLTHSITLHSCNRNITLKTAGLPVETCRWKYHNRSTSLELSAFSSLLL